MQPHLRKPSGFSLPEVMMAVVILGLLAGVVGPNLYNFILVQRLRSAAVNLSFQLNAARAAAQRSDLACELVLVGSVLQPAATPTGNCGTQPPAPLNLSQDAQGATVTLSGADTSFRFAPGGMMIGTTAEQLLFLSVAGNTPRVCVRVQRPSAVVSIGVASDGNTCVYNS
jgi:prepilin-type N-terminal cleavage/methylation domain-containing protein